MGSTTLEVHWMTDASREDRAPRSDVPKQQREGSRHGGQKRRARNEKARKAVKNALEEELIEEMYRMIL